MPLEGKIISVNVTVLLAALVILGFTSVSIAAEDISSLVKQVMPGVVLIQTYDSNGNELGQGSGFVISEDGDVVTCYHVMRGYSTAIVTTADEKIFQVRNVIAINKSDDLVRISLSADNHSFSNLSLNTTTPEVGQEVIAIGGPLGLEKTVSQGIVSAIRNNTIQITAPISPGSSGGPVFNMNGEVIGIVSSQMKSGQNLNFAIPANLISIMEPASAEQIDELYSIDESYYTSEEEIHKTITRSVEQTIALNGGNLVPYGLPIIAINDLVSHVECNILDNKSMLVKIYIVDNRDPTKLIYGGCNFPKAAILAHILAVNMDTSIEDMTVQIWNSTGIQTTMCSYRSLISGTSSADLKIDPSYANVYSATVNILANKLLTTMKPVIGVMRVSGKIQPVKGY